MKLLLTSILVLGATSTALAQDEEAYIPNGVITSIKASPANGGINPQYVGFNLSGTIKAGGNACEASRYEVDIRAVKVGQWVYYQPSATLKQSEIENPTFCILSYDFNFKGLEFSKTFQLTQTQLNRALVNDVYELGKRAKVKQLLKKPTCKTDEVLMCTTEYQPSTCTYKNISGSGTNGCQARNDLRSKACSQGVALEESAIKCVSDDVVFQ